LLWILLLTLAGQALGSGYASVAESLKPFSQVLKVVLGLAFLAGVCWLGLRLLRARNRAE
jgi:membrane protein DedA with SNARE-associated domain